MRTVNGGGDQLARGATRVTFRNAEVSEEKYNEATKGFNLEKFLAKKSSGDTSIEETRTVGADPRIPRERKR